MPGISNPSELLAWLEDHRILQVRTIFPDMNGCSRGKILPIKKFLASLEDGVRFPRSVLVQDVTGENSPVPGFDFESGDSDFAAIPDLKTLCLVAGVPHTAQVILDARSLQAPHELLEETPRAVLRRVVQQAQELELNLIMASELEFYLFKPGFQPLRDGRPAYSMTHVSELQGLVERLLEALPSLGLDPEAGLHEYAPGQLEINFGPLPPLEMADRTFYFKHTVKELAAQAGYTATFMAKPISGHSGSGFHVHCSAWKNGQNLFWNPESSAEPEVLRCFLAGLIEHARETFAFLAPNINSYRRHVLGEYVPTTANWGRDDRTVALRLPAPTAKAARIEHRMAGADANPHLLLAALLAAGLDGIQRKLSLNQQPNRPGPTFPRSLAESLEALAASDWCRDRLGPSAIEIFLTIKRQELMKFHSHITTWELETYGHAL